MTPDRIPEDQNRDEPQFRLTISPAPTEIERTAIAAAITLLALSAAEPESGAPPRSKWLEAARREALRPAGHGPHIAAARYPGRQSR